MKHFKKIALLMMAAVFLTVLPAGNVLKASAAEPTKYLVIYDADDETWSYRIGGENWDNSVDSAHPQSELNYYLQQDFKDGDILIFEGDAPYDKRVEVDLSQYRISNLTFKQGASGIVMKAGSIDECYVLGNSNPSITGTITNAYVYDAASVNFCSDIINLNIIGTGVDVHATVYCQGTVGHVLAKDDTWVRYEYYDIAQGRLVVENGSFWTEAAYYSTTPSAATQQKLQTPNKTNASDAYDKVPKTGDNIPVSLILAGIAAICFAGRVALKRA